MDLKIESMPGTNAATSVDPVFVTAITQEAIPGFLITERSQQNRLANEALLQSFESSKKIIHTRNLTDVARLITLN